MTRLSDQFTYSIDQQESLYEGFYRMNQLTIRHQRFNGETMAIKRELMDRPDAVVIMLIDFKLNEMVFIEQFRVGAMREDNPWLVEMVAGLIDKDESPEEVARREAEEEAGVTVGRTQFICRYLPSPGGSNERVFLYVGEVDAATAHGIHGLEDEGEDIQVVRIPLQQAFDGVNNGLINNAASIIGLQWLQLHESRLRTEWA